MECRDARARVYARVLPCMFLCVCVGRGGRGGGGSPLVNGRPRRARADVCMCMCKCVRVCVRPHVCACVHVHVGARGSRGWGRTSRRRALRMDRAVTRPGRRRPGGPLIGPAGRIKCITEAADEPCAPPSCGQEGAPPPLLPRLAAPRGVPRILCAAAAAPPPRSRRQQQQRHRGPAPAALVFALRLGQKDVSGPKRRGKLEGNHWAAALYVAREAPQAVTRPYNRSESRASRSRAGSLLQSVV